MQESVIIASYGTDRSVLLASKIWDPLSMYQNNVTDADRG